MLLLLFCFVLFCFCLFFVCFLFCFGLFGFVFLFFFYFCSLFVCSFFLLLVFLKFPPCGSSPIWNSPLWDLYSCNMLGTVVLSIYTHCWKYEPFDWSIDQSVNQPSNQLFNHRYSIISSTTKCSYTHSSFENLAREPWESHLFPNKYVLFCVWMAQTALLLPHSSIVWTVSVCKKGVHVCFVERYTNVNSL